MLALTTSRSVACKDPWLYVQNARVADLVLQIFYKSKFKFYLNNKKLTEILKKTNAFFCEEQWDFLNRLALITNLKYIIIEGL